MCTSLAAGRAATTRGVTLIARNEDCVRASWNKMMLARPEPEYVAARASVLDADGRWVLGNGLTVTVPESAFAYTGVPDAISWSEAHRAIGNRFFFEERGINDRNVAISATNSLSMNRAAATADPLLAEGGLAESILPTLLLPQMTSARHGVELVAGYMETAGASEANGLLISDPSEVWYVEIGSRRHWIAVRVPDDTYLVVANGMRVHDVDLDSAGVRHSPGLVEFVRAQGLLAAPERAAFDFAGAFGKPGVSYNIDREWLAQHVLSPSRAEAPRQGRYPLFLRPDAPLEVSDAIRVLTATYEGTPLEGIATRSVGWDKTGESHIITLDPGMPAPVCGVIWQAISTPLCSPYLPLFAAMRSVPAVYARGDNAYGGNSAYWAYRSVFALATAEGPAALAAERARWSNYEAQLLAEHGPLCAMLSDMAGTDPEMAAGFAGRYSRGLAHDGVDRALGRRDALMTGIAGTS